jgi:hypothetical protein
MLPPNPKTNPIFQRLTRHTYAPFSLREAVWLAGVGVLVLIVSLIGPVSTDIAGTLSGLSRLAAGLVYPAVALFGAMMAASITGRDASTDLYQLMRQTPVVSTDIVWGYIFTTLYRLRALLALMIALLPALLFGNILIWAGDILYLLQGLGIQIIQTIAQWGVFFFGVIVGVSEGLLHKKVFPGVIAAPLLVILFWTATLVVCGSLAGIHLLFAPSTTGAMYRFSGLSLSRVVLFYPLIWVFFRLASRWA